MSLVIDKYRGGAAIRAWRRRLRDLHRTGCAFTADPAIVADARLLLGTGVGTVIAGGGRPAGVGAVTSWRVAA